MKTVRLIIRNEYESGISGAHKQASNEDGDIVGAFFVRLDSGVEAVRGFAVSLLRTVQQMGLEQVDGVVILIPKAFRRTLDRKVAGDKFKKARKHLDDALCFKRTSPVWIASKRP